MNRDQLRRSCGWIGGADSGWRVMDDPTPVLLRVRLCVWSDFADREEVAL